MGPVVNDPVLARRAAAARLADAGRRAGYGLYAVAVVAFFVGLSGRFTGLVAGVVVAALAAGSVLLAPAIVLGYAVRAADREDRDQRR
jgi:hypothetical protein